ncbi:T9SS type A sorting domain-containing protein [bacterium SCSIO 12741]|nr:T9SS type A sorting domain-containing protein [bacterium SCSIO 12741]
MGIDKMRILLLIILAMAGVGTAMSQTGPGGVGNSTSNGLWLKANSLNLSDTDPIDTWDDSSGNSNDGNSGGTGRPLYVASSSMNSMPAVRFDGVVDTMTILDDALLDNSSGLTYFAVVRPSNLDGTPRPILGKRISYGSSDYAYTWFFFGSNTLTLDINTGNNRFNTSPTTFSNSTNYLLNFNYDGSLAAASRSTISSAGTLVKTSTESSTTVLNSSANLTLAVLNSGDGREFGGDYAELIQYNFSLNDAQSIIVHNYLSAKYNIALTSNDVYDEDDNGDYDYEVAGIGQASDGSNHTEAQGSGIVRMLAANDLDNSEFLIWGHNNEALSATGVTDLPATIQARLARDWSASETGEVGTTTVRFDLSGVPGSITTSDLRLLIDADGTYSSGATILGPPTSLGSNVYEWTGVDIDNNDHFTIGSINSAQTPLPVELIVFHAKGGPNSVVELSWQTATEINNHYFTVERSKDAVKWFEVSKADGAGNSSTLLNYASVDNNPYDGLSYYRLKQTDFDGQYKYSMVRSVNLEKLQNSSVDIYPNPTQEKFTVKADHLELEQIILFNSLGEKITKGITITRGKDQGIADIDISELQSGMYYLLTKTTANKVYKQ